jgi:hypothetical protein
LTLFLEAILNVHPQNDTAAMLSRRQWLLRAGGGLGGVALGSLLATESAKAGGPGATSKIENPFAPKATHFAPRAKRVIWLFMHGGPSHMDLFDPKPDLIKYAGQPIPESIGPVMTRRDVGKNTLMGPIKKFRKRGQSGLEVSDFLPHMAECADDLCVIRSCHGDSVNHPQSVYQMNTGSILMGNPSMGSWISYGLGTENQDMPAFVVLPDPSGGLKGGPPAWGSGFLPATHQGTQMRAGANPILNLRPQSSMTASRQTRTLDLIRQMNAEHLDQRGAGDDLAARINSYELAYRMQAKAPGIVGIDGETEATRRMYGVDQDETRDFGTRCLMARRMIERGVRFVQLYSGDKNGWDAHNDVLDNHTTYCRKTDQPVAALLNDLKQRGLWEETLVIWGSEFGRMPMNEKGKGRDHNPWGYSVVLAGGAVKGGTSYGATDPIGLRAAENKVHVNDLHATILHLLGMDHEKLTFPHNGLDKRLTGVAGNVVTDILA